MIRVEGSRNIREMIEGMFVRGQSSKLRSHYSSHAAFRCVRQHGDFAALRFFALKGQSFWA